MTDELSKYIDTYTVNDLREILKQHYRIEVSRGTKKQALVAKLMSCMRLQAAMTTKA